MAGRTSQGFLHKLQDPRPFLLPAGHAGRHGRQRQRGARALQRGPLSHAQARRDACCTQAQDLRPPSSCPVIATLGAWQATLSPSLKPSSTLCKYGKYLRPSELVYQPTVLGMRHENALPQTWRQRRRPP